MDSGFLVIPGAKAVNDVSLGLRVATLFDARQIAAATVFGVDLIVSWNFKHIVHFEKIQGYDDANTRDGYPAVAIHSSRNVIEQ